MPWRKCDRHMGIPSTPTPPPRYQLLEHDHDKDSPQLPPPHPHPRCCCCISSPPFPVPGDDGKWSTLSAPQRVKLRLLEMQLSISSLVVELDNEIKYAMDQEGLRDQAQPAGAADKAGPMELSQIVWARDTRTGIKTPFRLRGRLPPHGFPTLKRVRLSTPPGLDSPCSSSIHLSSMPTSPNCLLGRLVEQLPRPIRRNITHGLSITVSGNMTKK